jgi:hypothetical protein
MNIEPGVYRHYKGELYVVLGVARHHETGIQYVVYHPIKPHGEEKRLRVNIRPVTPQPNDPDSWTTEIPPGPMTRDKKPRQRFTFLYPLG